MPAHPPVDDPTDTPGNPKPSKRPRLPQLRRSSRPVQSSSSFPKTGSNTSSIVTMKVTGSRVKTKATERTHVLATPQRPIQLCEVNNDPPDMNPPQETLLPTPTADAPLQRKRDRTTKVCQPRSHFFLILTSLKSQLVQWLSLRDSTLDELLRHDGFASHMKCMICSDQEASFRCKDCGHGTALWCQSCLSMHHHGLELHRVEVRVFYIHFFPC